MVVLNKMSIVATTAANAGLDFKLHAGYSAETSGRVECIMWSYCSLLLYMVLTTGGLLVALPQEQAKAFCQELEVSKRVLMLHVLSPLCFLLNRKEMHPLHGS